MNRHRGEQSKVHTLVSLRQLVYDYVNRYTFIFFMFRVDFGHFLIVLSLVVNSFKFFAIHCTKTLDNVYCNALG